MHMRHLRFLPAVLFLITLSTIALAQTPDPHSIPALDAGIGTCSADFTVTDSSGGPVYNAKIKVHIAYGTWSIRKLDLEVSTNTDGKARFTGLPNKLKRELTFEATEGDRQAEASDDVNKTCSAQLTLALQKKPQ
jgi:outer membrane lipoprotein-sorting protein